MLDTVPSLEEMEQRYFELVWYARSAGIEPWCTRSKIIENKTRDAVENAATASEARIEMERADDVAMLRKEPLYQVAFNEGAMAAFRYALNPSSKGFPDDGYLDT